MQRRRKTGLIKTIERIRQAPLSHRRRVAFVSSLTMTLLIASVWAAVIFPRTFSMSNGQDMTASGSAPFEQIFDDATVIFDDMRSGVTEIRAKSSGIFQDRRSEERSMNEDADAAEGRQNELPLRNSAVEEISTENDPSEGSFQEDDMNIRSEESPPAERAVTEQGGASSEDGRGAEQE